MLVFEKKVRTGQQDRTVKKVTKW